MEQVLLKMQNITKTFGNVKALNNVNLELRSGEVHALMGENGAGKSTLMKILTGVYSLESGTVTYLGKDVKFDNTKQAQEVGIAIVHQELNMLNDLTVAQNIFIGRESMNGKIINDKEMIEKSKELFKILEVDVDPRTVVGELPVGIQQMTEIAKAISLNANVIVFDEPTSSLTEEEIGHLFKVIDRLQKKGVGIIYISHRMDEIGKISDRITVLRDGGYVGTVNTKETSRDELINMMVGRVSYVEPKTKSSIADNAAVVLEVKNLNRGKKIRDVSFVLKKGEILGMAGLMGSGRTEVARAIFGADKLDSGEILLYNKKVNIKNTEDAAKHGIGYLSEDRRVDGVITGFPIKDNISICAIDDFIKNKIIDDKKIEEVSDSFVTSLNIKCFSSDQVVKTLSGGNQQKVIVAKWLVRDSEILIFDEPTKGIDIGAKNEIYKIINKLAKAGKSIIVISSEMDEILRLSDRIIVMAEGKKAGELKIEDASQEKILELASVED